MNQNLVFQIMNPLPLIKDNLKYIMLFTYARPDIFF
jgi:hypothetical protein